MHRTSLEQTLASVRIDAGTTTQCTECQTPLGECDLITIRLGHSDQSPMFNLRACYCLGCAPTGFAELPNIAQTETLVEARLGIAQDSHRQASGLIPISPTVIDTTRSTRLSSRAAPEQEVRE